MKQLQQFAAVVMAAVALLLGSAGVASAATAHSATAKPDKAAIDLVIGCTGARYIGACADKKAVLRARQEVFAYTASALDVRAICSNGQNRSIKTHYWRMGFCQNRLYSTKRYGYVAHNLSSDGIANRAAILNGYSIFS